jgi:hypothetical protein
MFDTLFNYLDLLSGLDSGGTSQAPNAPASRLFSAKIGVCIGEGFLFHANDFKTYSSIRP